MAVVYKIESSALSDNDVQIFGMAYSDTGETVKIDVRPASEDGLVSMARTIRLDITKDIPQLSEDYTAGFRLWIRTHHKRRLFPLVLTFDDGRENTSVTLSYSDIEKRSINNSSSIVSLYNRAIRVLRQQGISGFLKKLRRKLKQIKSTNAISYTQWITNNEPSEKELSRQRKREAHLTERPLVSVVVPLYNTPVGLFKEMTESVLAQTYMNWELCLADGGDSDTLARMAEEYVKADKRIKYSKLSENKGISENTNAAIDMAGGELIAFLDHDDTLAPFALYEVVNAGIKDKTAEVFYSDQDKLSDDGKERYEPVFKSDFDADFLRSQNYICHLLVIKKELIERIGKFDKSFDGAQDYDFILRATEKAKSVCHIPKVLYHWRATEGSTAEAAEAKDYAFEAGCRAVYEHCKRIGLPAEVERSVLDGNYRIKVDIDAMTALRPKVSVIIPNKDLVSDLDKCLKSLIKQNYSNLEIIVIENNSEEKETFEYYESLHGLDSRIRVIRYEGEFNYSAINNFGVGSSDGEYILLLNNDTEMSDDNVITEMLSNALRSEVGIVGAKLLYGDETIQHAGVIVGYGVAEHAFAGYYQNDYGYENRIINTHACSAVTAACLMTKRSIYEKVGGLDEKLKVTFNDVDYCLKVREAGYLVLYDAYACAYHYESKSRGYESDKEKAKRSENEAQLITERWSKYFIYGDPHYNINLNYDIARNLYDIGVIPKI